MRKLVPAKMSKGVVSPGWAEAMVEKLKNGSSRRLYDGNFFFRATGSDLDSSLRQVANLDFKDLSGVVAWFTSQSYSPRQISRLALDRQERILNLSPEEPGRLTSTRFLLSGFLDDARKADPELHHNGDVTDLLGMHADYGNETWVVPESAIEMVTPVVATAQVHLPHQTV